MQKNVTRTPITTGWRSFKDVIILASIFLFVFVLAVSFDSFETIVDFVETHEQWELDEVITGTIILAACLLVYSILKTQKATKAEKRVDKANKKLVEINEKLRIVGSLTRHDVQNKLAIIANNLYLAKLKLSPDAETVNTFESVENNLDQIKYIFSFAGVYEKIGVEKPSILNVGKCVKDAAKLLGLENIELTNKCSDLSVFADSLLTQVFYNLMHNSLVHGKTVTQIKVYHEQNARHKKIVYEDNGAGIPAKEKELIFTEGYGKGTGYGMFLVMKICDAYGWTITETGEEGKGARFVMEIPKNGY